MTLYRIHVFLYFAFMVYVKIINAQKYNTIQVEIKRSTVYNPTVIDKTCMLRPDPGPCRAALSMYYYNPAIKNCTKFEWGGCQGNGNRFDTLSECLTGCLSQPNPKLTRPNWCNLSFDYGFCFGALKRWHYDSLWKVCKERIYSGCGGNKNNFYNKEQCDSICRYGNRVLKSKPDGGEGISKVLIVNPKTTKSG